MSFVRIYWLYIRSSRWWLGPLAIAGGLVCLWGSQHHWQQTDADSLRFKETGVLVAGKIIQKTERSDWHGAASKLKYSLRYRYTDNAGAEHHGNAEVSEPMWKRYHLDDTVSVTFLAGEPATSQLSEHGDHAKHPAQLVALFCGTALVVGGTVHLLYIFVRAWRKVRVIKHGVASVARVDHVTSDAPEIRNGDHQGGKTARRRLGYSFVDHRGIARDGETMLLPFHLASRWRPGDPILVVYHPDHVLRHEVDLFGARSEELARQLDSSQGRN